MVINRAPRRGPLVAAVSYHGNSQRPQERRHSHDRSAGAALGAVVPGGGDAPAAAGRAAWSSRPLCRPSDRQRIGSAAGAAGLDGAWLAGAAGRALPPDGASACRAGRCPGTPAQQTALGTAAEPAGGRAAAADRPAGRLVAPAVGALATRRSRGGH